MKVEIAPILLKDDPKKIKAISNFIDDNKLKIRQITTESWMLNSVAYQKLEGFWNIHLYNYTRHLGTAFPYINLSLVSIKRRENTWFQTVNPINVDKLNRRILLDYFSEDTEYLGLEKFRQVTFQGINLAFEIDKMLNEGLITPTEIMGLYADSELLLERAGYCAALKHNKLTKEAKEIIDFFWQNEKEEYIKTIERIDDCLKQNKIKLLDFFYIQKNHNEELNQITFDEKLNLLMDNENLPYDLAISFAGENRDIAKRISLDLKKRGYNIFYDEFEKSKMWGKDLYEYLSQVYSKKSKYCLIVISEDYVKKTWTRLERKAAQSRAFSEENEYILPLKLDETEIPGILSTTGYIDFHRESYENIIELLIEKINNFHSNN